jgi:hypothetical protein
MELKEFVKKNYEVLYGDINEADEFLLVDSPDSLGHREINSLFINTYATDTDTVLVQPLQSSWLKTTAKIVRWDKEIVEEIQKLPICVQNEKSEIKLNLILRQLHESNDEDLELISKLKEAIRFNFGLIGELFKYEKEIADIEAKTVPAGVKSIKSSLIEAKKQSKRSFLIAKSSYLMPEEQSGESIAPSKELQQFIEARKVVILLPKKVMVEELNKKHKNFFRSLFQETPKIQA